jgi:hypothetical protein
MIYILEDFLLLFIFWEKLRGNLQSRWFFILQPAGAGAGCNKSSQALEMLLRF